MKQRILLLCAILMAVSSARIEFLNGDSHVRHNLRTTKDPSDWWETAVFYQIYPRSFMDSDNDGIGDLQGIIQRLYHLKDLGITATWLSPIFKSPQVDQGYDISDYTAIESEYGTMDDLKSLIAKAKELGIKIILDFVPNHTSDEHEWFTKSKAKEAGYENYYIWHDGIPDPSNPSGRPLVPNNWISNFKGSAWEWNEDRNQYYYHQFAVKQPDLNYSDPNLLNDMKDILKFWLDAGVDGFRIDAVPYLFEDPEFRNEDLASGYTTYDVEDPNCLDHTYTKDLAPTFEIIYQFREVTDNYAKINKTETKVLMTEAYSPIEKQRLFYGSSDSLRAGAHFTFNFNFISDLTNADFTIDDIANAINKWLAYIPEQYTSNWVLGNHDNHRVATRFGKENVDGFNMLTAILPGVMVTYNGEEIGMEDGEVTCKQGHDPQAIKNNCANETTFQAISRDFERTPFQWDSSVNSGFNKGATPWLPVSSKANETNIASQNGTGVLSHLNVYKDLLKFRENFKDTADLDAVSVIKLSNNVLQVIRHRDKKEFSLLFNIGKTKETVEVFKTKGSYKVIVASVGSSYKAGDFFSSVTLSAHESLIVESSSTIMQCLSLSILFIVHILHKLFF